MLGSIEGRWALVMIAGLALAACGKGAGGTSVDGGDASSVQEDATASPDSARDSAPQVDGADDGTTADGAPADGAPPDGTTQPDGGVNGCVVGTFAPYFGDLHAHSSYSDGAGTPAEAYTYARDTGKLDIMVLTDHCEQIWLHGGWGQYQADADDFYAAGTFLAMAGFEYGSGFRLPLFTSTGHNNVFFATDIFPKVQLDYHDFYASLVACGTCIGQFNHPGDGQDINWDGFEYHADVDQRMNLFELNSDPAWDLFFVALDQGWTISPMWNQDNHSANWGTANDNRSGFWMTTLDRTSMYDAMLNRRSFATQDKKAWIKLMAAGDCWMGSILHGLSSVPITVEVNDTDNDTGFTKIDLFGPGKTSLGTHDCAGAMTCTASFNVPVTSPPGATYAVARATMTNAKILVSAPVWAILQ